MSWLKANIVKWLQDHCVELPHGISHFNCLTKPHLIQLSKTRPVKPKYIVEDLAEKCGKDVKVLWLPVAHCEFNPIELIWSFVKGYVAKHNDGKNLSEMLNLTKEALGSVTSDLWKNCIKHAIKYEDVMWDRDHIVDIAMEEALCSVVVPLQDDDTSSDEDSESDSKYDSDELPDIN